MPDESSVPNSPEISASRPGSPVPVRPLRVWPALVLVVIMLGLRFVPAMMEDGLSKYWMAVVFGPLGCSLLLVVWWLGASRAVWRERLLGMGGLVAMIVVLSLFVERSMIGPGIMYLMIPMGLLAFAVGVSLLRQSRPLKRTGVALLLALAAGGFSLLLRNEGMTGSYSLGLHWRWTPTAEELMLANRKSDTSEKPNGTPIDPHELEESLAHPEWPGFRGTDRANRQRGPVIATNWTANPPEQLWKISVGPGWGSFAVAGDRLFTQEQRGPMESVVCYDANTGREIWVQQTEARFDDPLGGPGPRATPTLAGGKLFVTGATGWFACLDAMTGKIFWEQQLQAVAGREPPMWGFTASPLVVDPVAIVYAGGAGDKGVLAFDIHSGELRWSAAAGDHSYSSPQLNTIVGEQLVLMLSNEGLRLLEAKTGQLRLNYEWTFGNYRALQPQVVGGDTILLPTGMNTGTRAIRITKKGDDLAAEELWTSRNLKPDFNDFVVYDGNAYGFDGGLFASVNLATGDRNWKGGRYGKGQVLLLESSGLLLIAAERGDVVLLKADPTDHREVASFKALDGKTWNHPVVVNDRLYLRNSQEAACYRLPLAQPGAAPTP